MEQAFKDFYYQHFDKLRAYAFTIVLDNAEAKDITQRAFIKLWEKRAQVDLQDPALSYLYTIVYNLSLNAVRDKKNREKKYQASANTIIKQDYNYLEEKELRTRIASDIENLPEKCREVFKKSRYHGMKYSEIASDMGISIKTVELHMTTALRLLREKLADLAFIIHPGLLIICML